MPKNPIEIFKGPITQHLEKHGVSEEEIQSVLKRIKDLTDSIIGMFDDMSELWQRQEKLNHNEKDRKSMQLLRSRIEAFCKKHPGSADTARPFINTMNQLETRLKKARKG